MSLTHWSSFLESFNNLALDSSLLTTKVFRPPLNPLFSLKLRHKALKDLNTQNRITPMPGCYLGKAFLPLQEDELISLAGLR